MMYPYRVFVSYAREDHELMKNMVATLQSMGLVPIWDQDIRPGTRFSDAIKEKIATAHIFMPLITKNSQQRPWVHQETGYAVGLDVPVVPIALNTVPGEMISELQAISVEADLSDLARRLREANLMNIVLSPLPAPFLGTQVAQAPEERTKWLIEYSNWLLENQRHGQLRQRALFSSFSIPDRDPSHPVWDRHDGGSRKSPELRHLLRNERIVLERHARIQGCALMLAPDVDFRTVGPEVHRTQLETLLECIDSFPKDRIDIVFSNRVDDGNVTIIGDWFVAYAPIQPPGALYRQSVFTSHAPTVLKWSRLFDQHVAEAIAGETLSRADRLESALTRLKARLSALPRV